MNIREAYQTLELDYGAPLDEIETSFKRLIRVWHPDRFVKNADLYSHAGEKSKRLNEARETLRSAWSTGRLVDEFAGDASSAPENEQYEDQSVKYFGYDPRVRALQAKEVEQGRESMVTLTKQGLILATIKRGDVDEVFYYPTLHLRSVRSVERGFVRPDLSTCEGRVPSDAGAVVVADDPEELVPNFQLMLLFRNSYFAKLFVKRASAIFGMKQTEVRTELSPNKADDLNNLMLLAIFAVVIVLMVAMFATVSTKRSGLVPLPNRGVVSIIGRGLGNRDPNHGILPRSRLPAFHPTRGAFRGSLHHDY